MKLSTFCYLLSKIIAKASFHDPKINDFKHYSKKINEKINDLIQQTFLNFKQLFFIPRGSQNNNTNYIPLHVVLGYNREVPVNALCKVTPTVTRRTFVKRTVFVEKIKIVFPTTSFVILQDAIDELIETYNSIDVRVFCIFKDNAWNNIFTIIRFRREKLEELKKHHEKIIEKCGELINTDEFRTGLFQFPIERWSKIRDDLANKFICLRDDFAVNYVKPIGFQHSIYSPYSESDKEFVFKDWKFFHGHTEERERNFPYSDKLVDEAIKNHFTHVDDYLAGIFEIDKYDFQRNPWIDIFVPVFLKVDNIDFDSSKVDVTISSFAQQKLEIAFNFFGGKLRPKTELIEKKIETINLENVEKLQTKIITIPINTVNLKNEFELLIVKNKKILLVEERNNISRFWDNRNEFTYPYLAIFEKYVGFDELERMLFEFKSKHGGDESKVFEKAISWILSMVKLPNIMLDKYEKIGSGVDSVSTDIISSHDKNKILLVNATTRLPKQSDFDRERDFRENLSRYIKNDEIEFVSVYFTGKDATESIQSADSNKVNLIGKTKLKMVLQYLKEGEIEKSRRMILNKEF